MRAVTTSFPALLACGTSGVPLLRRGFSEPKIRHGLIATTNASDSCAGPHGLPFLGCAAGGVFVTRHHRSPRLPERHLLDMSPTQTPPVHCRSPRRLVWASTLRPSPKTEKLGCREYSFEAHLCGSYVHCDLSVRLHACSPPRLTATQLARSSVLNRLIAPAGLAPALTPASRAHQPLESRI